MDGDSKIRWTATFWREPLLSIWALPPPPGSLVLTIPGYRDTPLPTMASGLPH
jgi:hypothetical protein